MQIPCVVGCVVPQPFLILPFLEMDLARSHKNEAQSQSIAFCSETVSVASISVCGDFKNVAVYIVVSEWSVKFAIILLHV